MQQEHQNSNTNFLKPQVEVVCIVYLSASICQYFCKYLYVFGQYLQVLHLFASIDATNTFVRLEYLQILAILANTNRDTCRYLHQILANTCKYVEIDQFVLHVFACICMYLAVYACILYISDIKLFYSQYFACICMYMHKFGQ